MPKKPNSPLLTPTRLMLTAVFAVAAGMYISARNAPKKPQGPVLTNTPYTALVGEIKSHEISRVDMYGRTLVATKGDDAEPSIRSYLPENANLVEATKGTDVTINAVEPPPPPQPSFVQRHQFLIMLLLFVGLPIGAMFWFYRAQKKSMEGGSGSGGAMSFAKSRAKRVDTKEKKVTFADVAGVDEAREDLEEIVEYLKDPAKFVKLGGKMPTGVLMVGPPGTGKTLTARAVAGEAGVPFFSASGSDFVEMFVGVGAARVRNMFEQARMNAPCILFIDEIDAVGGKRGMNSGGGGDREHGQTLNALLVEMDGFEENKGVIVIGATNQPEALDAALLRPGRFDRQVALNLPDVNGRKQILEVHAKKVPLATDVDLLTVARGTPGFSGADLANLINEAALRAARLNRTAVGMDEIEWAKDKVFMGAERRSLMMSEHEKRLTAYHEAGHVIVGLYEPKCDPLHKVTIVPRGRALGVTWSLPQGDRVSLSRDHLMGDIAKLYGGREAEERVFGKGEVTTGASNDIQRATDLAERMVKEWGMSDVVGARRYVSDERMSFLGGGGSQSKGVSGQVQGMIDEEINGILARGQERAKTIISDHYNEFVNIAEALYKYETLSAEDITAISKGEDIAERKEAERQALEARTDKPAPKTPGNDNENTPEKPKWDTLPFRRKNSGPNGPS